ncbi:hypothetical protein B296_00035225 [Ensete ventricosum]|uniref:Uncharacterized protein n=1 Tax=Ensete ventricosum TaxID=4639 RepID=A0A426ZYU5_ENSVE|nr:hypothetical protein B296_00035225 [Ensete ventricosum]
MIEGLLQSGLAKVKSMHRVDAVGNSPGVRRELAKGIRSLLGWHKGVCQKKTETRRKIIGGLTVTGAMKLQPDDEPRLSLSIGPGFGRCSGISSEFARRFAEGSEKLAGSTPGDCQEKTKRLTASMSEATGMQMLGLNLACGH